ncbi:cell division control protein, partial [Reticulomyxa filosa]
MRTFKTNGFFKARVSEKSLIRVINSYCHKTGCRYVQGMDVIAAMLLLNMSELDAFATFYALLENHLPTYWVTFPEEHGLAGAFGSTMLVYEIIRLVDKKLSDHLNDPRIHPFACFFPVMSSLLSITKPIVEVMRLWDFLFAFGVHMIVPCVAAQVMAMKELILSQPPHLVPARVISQRNWPKLKASEVIAKVMKDILPVLQKDKLIWQQILDHGSKFETANGLLARGKRQLEQQKEFLAIRKHSLQNDWKRDDGNGDGDNNGGSGHNHVSPTKDDSKYGQMNGNGNGNGNASDVATGSSNVHYHRKIASTIHDFETKALPALPNYVTSLANITPRSMSMSFGNVGGQFKNILHKTLNLVNDDPFFTRSNEALLGYQVNGIDPADLPCVYPATSQKGSPKKPMQSIPSSANPKQDEQTQMYKQRSASTSNNHSTNKMDIHANGNGNGNGNGNDNNNGNVHTTQMTSTTNGNQVLSLDVLSQSVFQRYNIPENLRHLIHNLNGGKNDTEMSPTQSVRHPNGVPLPQ